MDWKNLFALILLIVCITSAKVRFYNFQTEQSIANAIPNHNLALLIVFNGDHDQEAENLLASIKLHTPQFIPYIVVCVSDAKSKNFALKHKLNYFVMPTIVKSGVYMTREMNVMTSRKFEAVVHLLAQNKQVLYVDTDVVFLANPLPWIKLDFDLNIQDDLCFMPPQHKELCTGFMYIQPNNRTIGFFKQAIAEMQARNYQGFADQTALNFLLEQQSVVSNSDNISVNELDLCKYPNGCRYFAQTYKFCRRSDALIVHNNYLVGIWEKMQRFREHGLLFEED